MKVLFITGSMGRGGAERVISIVSNAFIQEGWDVSIMQLLYNYCDYPLNQKIKVQDASNSRRNQIIDTPRMIYRVRREIEKTHPDTVISFMMTMNIVTAIACIGTRVRFIPSERNDPSMGRSKFMSMLTKFAYSISYRTVMQTERAKNYFSNKIQSKSIIIPNPVEVNVSADNTNFNRIVTVGRLTAQKNQSMLIDAFNLIKEDFPDLVLDIYGEGIKRDELEKKIDQYELSSRVHLKGNILDVHQKIKDAGLFVLSSDYEGTSNALLEAMMIGIPCISTDCAGSDEMIENGKSGIIVPVGDTIALANAISKMLSNQELALEMGKKGKERVSRKYSSEYVCQKWIKTAKGDC